MCISPSKLENLLQCLVVSSFASSNNRLGCFAWTNVRQNRVRLQGGSCRWVCGGSWEVRIHCGGVGRGRWHNRYGGGRSIRKVQLFQSRWECVQRWWWRGRLGQIRVFHKLDIARADNASGSHHPDLVSLSSMSGRIANHHTFTRFAFKPFCIWPVYIALASECSQV